MPLPDELISSLYRTINQIAAKEKTTTTNYSREKLENDLNVLLSQTSSITLTTIGSSGPATLIDNILNIPQYSNSSSSGNVLEVNVNNPTLISDGTYCTWLITNTLYDKYAAPLLINNITNEVVGMYPIITDTAITYKFVSSSNIAANLYRLSLQGIQKDAPIPPVGDFLLIEDGDTFLFESGEEILLD